MAAVRRFTNVSAPNSAVIHRFYAKRFVEGERTACGIAVRKGWPFWYGARMTQAQYRRCKRCDSISTIEVQVMRSPASEA